MSCRSVPGKEREERKAPLAGPLSPLWVYGVQPRMTDVLPIVPHQPPLCLLALLEFQETRSACVRVCAYAWACESEHVALSPSGAVCECKGGFVVVWIGAPKSEVPKLAKLLNTAPTVLSLKCTNTHENVQRRTFTDLNCTRKSKGFLTGSDEDLYCQKLLHTSLQQLSPEQAVIFKQQAAAV